MSTNGFTLLELLVVMSIIAIITTVGFNAYTNTQQTARNAQRKADLKQMQTALETFHSETGAYPNTGGEWWAECVYANSFVKKGNTGPNGYIPGLAPDFIPVLPRDPHHLLTNSSCYAYRSDGANYKLLAHSTPEGTWDSTDTYYDPCRPTWAWQVSSGAVPRGTPPCNWNSNGW